MPDSTSKIDSLALRPRTISSGEVGRILGNRYRLVAQIGAGASAQVFLADDLSLGRRVAVKCLRSGLSDDARFVKRFRAEATAAAQLSHPNLLAVYDWDESPSSAYIVTEVLLGGSLLDLLDRQPLSPSQGLLVALQVAQGLKYAHSIGWVHRDIKPANLLFGQEGRLRIADFGIARAVAEAAWTEPEGVLVGTARYAAPEQAEGDAIDGKADIYSLALTIVEAVTGRVPLLGENALSTMVLRQDRDVDGFEELGALGKALARAGRADPRARPTAAQLIENLTRTARALPRPQRLRLSSGPARFTHPTGEPDSADRVDGVEAADGAIDLRDKPETGLRVPNDEDLDGQPGGGHIAGDRPGFGSDSEVGGHELRRPGDRIKSRPIPRPSDGRVTRTRANQRPRFADHRITSASSQVDSPAVGSAEGMAAEVTLADQPSAAEPRIARTNAASAGPSETVSPITGGDTAQTPDSRVHEAEISEEAVLEEAVLEDAVLTESAIDDVVVVDVDDVDVVVEVVEVVEVVDVDVAEAPDTRLLELPDSPPFNPWRWRPPQVSSDDQSSTAPPKAAEPLAAPPTSSWLDQSKLDPSESTDPVEEPTPDWSASQAEPAPTVADAAGNDDFASGLNRVGRDFLGNDNSPPSQEREPTTELRVEQPAQEQRPRSVFAPPPATPDPLSETTFFTSSPSDVVSERQPAESQIDSSKAAAPPRKPLPITTPPAIKSPTSSSPAPPVPAPPAPAQPAPESPSPEPLSIERPAPEPSTGETPTVESPVVPPGPSPSKLDSALSAVGEATTVHRSGPTETGTDLGSKADTAASDPSSPERSTIPSIFDAPRKAGGHDQSQGHDQGQGVDQGQGHGQGRALDQGQGQSRAHDQSHGLEQSHGLDQSQGQSRSQTGSRSDARSNKSQRPGRAANVAPETTASVRAEVNQLRSRRRGRRQEPARPVRLTRLFEEDAGAVPPATKRLGDETAEAGTAPRLVAGAAAAGTEASATAPADSPDQPRAEAPTSNGRFQTHTSTPTHGNVASGGVSMVRLGADPAPDQVAAGSPVLGPPADGSTKAARVSALGAAPVDTAAVNTTAVNTGAVNTSAARTTALGTAALGAAAVGTGAIRTADVAGAPVVTSTETATRRRPQWLAMAVLICLILVMIGAVTAIAVRSESGTEAASPGSTVLSSSAVAGDYLGGPATDAEADAERNNWLLSITEERRSGTDAGEVIEQEPPAGNSLADGDRLNIVVSLGPDLRTVPSIVGRTLDEATVILERADLEVGEVSEVDPADFKADSDDADSDETSSDDTESDGEGGLVLAMEVKGDEPEARVEAGTAIDLIVSAGSSASPMPSFVGLTVSRATAQADDLGLRLRQEEAFSERYDEGFVVHTEPPTDALVEPGDTVTIIVSRGTPFVTIPNVTGMLPDEAAAELRAAGFEVVATSGEPDQLVVATDPAAGEAHRKGRAVTIITGP